ncbi:MAG: hypothetical protein EP343_31940 [Deltaproteobacteria bacterium]|nr:MAG: hypothetical protein EP343_31940 [Deltaproteobacteria bacterium]
MTDQDLQPFHNHYQKSRKATLFTAIGSFVIAGGLWFLPSNNSAQTKLLVAIVFGAIGVGLLAYQFLKVDPKNRASLEKFNSNFQDVVWIYIIQRTANQAHTHSIFHLHFLDGSKLELVVQGPDERKTTQMLVQHCQAVWDFHDEFKSMFAQNPASLREYYLSQQG